MTTCRPQGPVITAWTVSKSEIILKHGAVSTSALVVICIIFLYLKSKKLPLHSLISLRVLVAYRKCVKWARKVYRTLTPTNRAHQKASLMMPLSRKTSHRRRAPGTQIPALSCAAHSACNPFYLLHCIVLGEERQTPQPHNKATITTC